MPFRKGYQFEDFIDATSQVASKERLLEIFIETMARYGFDRVNFSIKRDRQVPEAERRFGIISTYPQEWQNYYADRGFIHIDPVLKCAAASFRPFTWRELERTLPLSDRQVRFLRMGEEAGLHNGLGIPFNGPRAQVAGVALATSTRTRDRFPNTVLISAFCNQFYETYKRLVGQIDALRPTVAHLSHREHEVLRWVAFGKTDEDISRLLSISENTVNYHLRRIYIKLEVNSRLTAVVAGITAGLIDL